MKLGLGLAGVSLQVVQQDLLGLHFIGRHERSHRLTSVA